MRIELINEEPTESIDPRSLLQNVLRAWPLFALSFAIFIALAALFHTAFPPIYQAEVSVLVDDPQGMNNPSPLVLEPRMRVDLARNFYVNEEVKLGSYGLVLDALKKMQHHVYYFSNGVLYEHIYDQAPFVVSIDAPNDLVRGHVPYNEPITITCTNGKVQLSGEGELANGEPWEFDQELDFGERFQLGAARVSVLLKDGYSREDICSKRLGFMLFDVEEQALELSDAIEVSQGKLDASVYKIALVGGPSPFVIDVLNAVADRYAQDDTERRETVLNHALTQIDAQLETVTTKLANSEDDIRSFKAANGITSLSHEGSLLLDRSYKLNEALVDAELNDKYYLHLSDHLKIDSESEPISPEAFGVDDRLLSNLTTEWIRLQNEKTVLERAGNVANPLYDRTILALSDIKGQLKSSIAGFKVSNDLKVNELKVQIARNRTEAYLIPAQEKVLMEFERIYRGQESNYQSLIAKRAEAGIAKAALVSNVSISEPAHLLDFDPFLPDPLISLVAVVLLSLLAPLAFLILRAVFSSKIRSLTQLDQLSHLPVAATIDHHAMTSSMDINDYPDSKYGDDIRALAAVLRQHGNGAFALIGLSDRSVARITADLAKTLQSSNLSIDVRKIDSGVRTPDTLSDPNITLWLVPSIAKRSAAFAAIGRSKLTFFICQRNATSISSLELANTFAKQDADKFKLVYIDSLEPNALQSKWNNEPRSFLWKLKRIIKRI